MTLEVKKGQFNGVYPSGCNKCHLRLQNSEIGANLFHPVMDGEGGTTPEVIFIGEAPGGEEDESGIPFVGPAGRLLRSALKNATYSYFLTNAVRCRPCKISEAKNIVNDTPSLKTIKCCKPLLMDELSQFTPKLYVLLGRTSIQSVLGSQFPIKSLRGPILKSEDQIPCLITYHPSAILRNRDDEIILKSFASDLELIPVFLDFLKNSKKQPEFNYIIDEKDWTSSSFADYYPEFLDKPCVIDFETSGLKIHSTEIICISLCWETNYVWIFNLQNPIIKNKLNSILKQIKPVAHNMAFDSQVAYKFFGIHWENYDDTMILHSIWYPEESHSLENISSILFPEYGNYKYVTKNGKMSEYKLEEVMKRCGYDTLVTFRLYNQLIDKLLINQKIIYGQMLQASKVLTGIMYKGVKINLQKLYQITKEYHEKLENCKRELHISFPECDFNSPLQVSKLFYGKLNFPNRKIGKSGNGSVSQDVLKELNLEIHHPILDKYMEFTSLKTLCSNTLKNLDTSILEDRVYTSYNITGARTSRLSSSAPNLQNITEPLREAFIPEENEIFIKCDLNQAELRWAGIISGDEKFIEIYNQPGTDLHDQVLQQMKKTIPKATRVDAKAVNFGMIYCQSSVGLSHQLHCSVEEATKLIKLNAKIFQGYWAWVRKIKQKIDIGIHVQTWWGRERKFSPEQLPAAVNYPIQSSASDFITLYLLPELGKIGIDQYIVLTTHDDIVFSVPNCQDTVALLIAWVEFLTNTFNQRIPIPMKFDYFCGNNWKDIKPILLDELKI